MQRTIFIQRSEEGPNAMNSYETSFMKLKVNLSTSPNIEDSYAFKHTQ